jgi:deoxyribodipyrimidine photo-lyase
MFTIVWFRQDLRLGDNPALVHAASLGEVLPVFVLDEPASDHEWRLGAASRWWLHHSLTALSTDLGGLTLLSGEPGKVLAALAKETGAGAVVWNRCYEPHAVARDTHIKAQLTGLGLEVASFNGSLLHEPWDIATNVGGPLKVFSPFWSVCLQRPALKLLGKSTLKIVSPSGIGEQLEDWCLRPAKPDWAASWTDLWTPGEAGACGASSRLSLRTGLSAMGNSGTGQL